MTTEAFHEHSIKQSKGSVNPYINFRDLTWYEFALPPVDEQRHIVVIMTAADAARAGYETVSRSATVVTNSVVESFLAHDDSDVVPLRDVCERVSDGPFGSKLKTEHYRTQGASCPAPEHSG